MHQKVILLGNLGADPEVRYTGGGDPVTTFSVATTERWKDRDSGEMQEVTEWHRCVAFKPLAEIIGKNFYKGSKIYLEGKNKTKKWEKDGQTHYTTDVKVDMFKFLDPKGGEKDFEPSGNQAPPDDFDDDIPF